MKFLFPAHPINAKVIDEYFHPQAEALAGPEGYALFSIENHTVKGVKPGDTVLYRGWMLNAGEYGLLSTLVGAAGGTMFTSLEQYTNTHYLPFWYHVISNLGVTAETQVYPIDYIESHPNGFETILRDELLRLRDRGWEKFFFKDFVKSLKTAGGSAVNNIEDAPHVIALMKQFRGSLEGGLCVRRFEEGLHGETRVFVVNRKPWAAFGDNVLSMGSEVLIVLEAVINRIDSPFFTIDYAFDAGERVRIIELGDGQVSDLVGNWTPALLNEILQPVLA